MLRLDWSEDAQTDFLEITGYIADRSPQAARALADDVSEKTTALTRFPHLAGEGRAPGTRELRIGRSYVIVYHVSETAISILRMLHTAQEWPPKI